MRTALLSVALAACLAACGLAPAPETGGPDMAADFDKPVAPASFEDAEKAKTDAAFAKAGHVARVEFYNNRLVCNFMEPRAAVGEWHADEDRFVLTTGSQGVHSMRNIIAGTVFKIDPSKLRVLTHDVGGGFGTKTANSGGRTIRDCGTPSRAAA